MNEQERDDRLRDAEGPDEQVDEYEDDEAEVRSSLEREAGLTAFGGPAFGQIFENEDADGGFDAEHNP